MPGGWGPPTWMVRPGARVAPSRHAGMSLPALCLGCRVGGGNPQLKVPSEKKKTPGPKWDVDTHAACLAPHHEPCVTRPAWSGRQGGKGACDGSARFLTSQSGRLPPQRRLGHRLLFQSRSSFGPRVAAVLRRASSGVSLFLPPAPLPPPLRRLRLLRALRLLARLRAGSVRGPALRLARCVQKAVPSFPWPRLGTAAPFLLCRSGRVLAVVPCAPRGSLRSPWGRARRVLGCPPRRPRPGPRLVHCRPLRGWWVGWLAPREAGKTPRLQPAELGAGAGFRLAPEKAADFFLNLSPSL